MPTKRVLDKIELWLTERGEPPYRFRQIDQAWYACSSWQEVNGWPLALRSAAEAEFPWLSISEAKVLSSPSDDTQKAIVKCADDQLIETVLMPNARDKWTACISSQVGCGMGCTFCATGTMGLKRNLTTDEIVDQIRFWRFREPKKDLSNVVFMGMGEPMANFDAVKVSATIFIKNMHIGATRITVSTVGFKSGLERLLDDAAFPPVRIAISLHAGTDATRASIVPSHKGTSMKQIADWAKKYVEKTSNRRHHLTFEYVMLWGVNDMPEEARALAKLFAPIHHRVKLNLIPWNPTSAPLKASSAERLQAFQNITQTAGIQTMIRYSKGLDITAACGQLVTNAENSAIGTERKA